MHTPVTPSLFLGTPPPGDDVRVVSSVEEAVRVIRSGMVAVLPEGSYEAAELVLMRLGVPDAKQKVVSAKRYA